MGTTYAEKEERFNIISHFIGFILALIGAFYLLSLSTTTKETFSYLVYTGSAAILYLMSTLYHSAKNPKARKALKVADHAAIYLFIAGSYTPFVLLKIQTSASERLLLIVWVLAFSGVVMKFFWAGRFKLISTLIYLAMGWLVVTLGEEVSYHLSTQTILWLVAGGLAYSLGSLIYLLKRIPYHHGIWHIFVLAGSIFHFIAIIS